MAILSILVLAAHLIAIDLAMVAPLACIWLAARQARRGDPLAGALDRRLARQSMIALAVGILLGTLQLGQLWLAGQRDFFSAAGRLPAGRLWFSLAELVFFFVCMAAYCVVRARSARRLLPGILAVLAATDLMYHFPPLFAMLNVLNTRPELAGQTLTSALYRQLMIDPEVVSMVLHVWLAAVAVTGVQVMRLASAAQPESAIDPSAAAGSVAPQSATSALGSIAAVAARWALGATVLQLPVGLGVLLASPPGSRAALMGGSLAGTVTFALAIVAAFGLMHHLAAAAQGEVARAQVRRSVLLMLAVVLLMTAALDRTRLWARGPLVVYRRAGAPLPATSSVPTAQFDPSPAWRRQVLPPASGLAGGNILFPSETR